MTVSPKSYGLAVCLAAIFGVIGIHHFYTGRILLGLCDFGLFIASATFYGLFLTTMNPTYGFLAAIVFILDLLHTIYVTFRLLVGAEHDGEGRIIAYPGQFGPDEDGTSDVFR